MSQNQGNEHVYLTLGCHGREEDGFVLCSSVKNNILEIKESLYHLDDMWDYFEGITLIDKPLIDINAVRNFLFRMQDKFDQNIKKLWSEKEFNAIERFMHMHKQCGIYIRLHIRNNEIVSKKEDEFVIIKANDNVIFPESFKIGKNNVKY